MTALAPPPTYQQVVDKDTGKATLPWILFFDQLFTGDQGTAWIPQIVGLTSVGTPSIVGTYYQVGSLVFFTIVIIPATNTSSTSGTTYCNNFPLKLSQQTSNTAVTNAPTAALGVCDSITQRIYFPSWTTITSQITISGWMVAS